MSKIFDTYYFKSRDEWLKCRGIGGSSASAILNANPYMSANELYDKMVYGDTDKSKSNEATIRGIELEPIIRKELAILHKDIYKIKNPPKNNWMFARKDKPYLTASLDGVIKDLRTNELGVLEIKTKEVRDIKEMSEWLSGNIPQNYYIQCLHYLMVSGYSFVLLHSYLIKRDYRSGEVEFIQVDTKKIYRKEKEEEIKKLEEIETRFYENCKKRIRPKIIVNTLVKKEV